MRKPINNETQLINEIWNGKLLNERRQSTEPSIYDPRMTNIMIDPATSAINRFLPWADRLGKAARGYKPREASETEGPTVSISDEDLESGETPEIVIEPIMHILTNLESYYNRQLALIIRLLEESLGMQ